jgi:hypothetical protein
MGLYVIMKVCTVWFIREMHEMLHGKRSLVRPRYMWEVILKGVIGI